MISVFNFFYIPSDNICAFTVFLTILLGLADFINIFRILLCSYIEHQSRYCILLHYHCKFVNFSFLWGGGLPDITGFLEGYEYRNVRDCLLVCQSRILSTTPLFLNRSYVLLSVISDLTTLITVVVVSI